MRRAVRHLGWVAVLVALIAAWQAYVRLRGVPQYVLPAPTDVARTLWDERGPLASAAGVTAREMLAGFAVALAFGFAAAVGLHASATVRRAVYPLLVASQSVPVVAIAPILVIYLGFGLAPKLVIVALVCFFPITVAALDGFRSVDPEHVRVMRTLRASRIADLPPRRAAVGAAVDLHRHAGGGLLRRRRRALRRVRRRRLRPRQRHARGHRPVRRAARRRGGGRAGGARARCCSGAVTLVERLTIPWARRVEVRREPFAGESRRG